MALSKVEILDAIAGMTIRETHTRDLTQRGVRLFRGRRIDTGTHPPLLWVSVQGRHLAFGDRSLTWLTHELI